MHTKAPALGVRAHSCPCALPLVPASHPWPAHVFFAPDRCAWMRDAGRLSRPVEACGRRRRPARFTVSCVCRGLWAGVDAYRVYHRRALSRRLRSRPLEAACGCVSCITAEDGGGVGVYVAVGVYVEHGVGYLLAGWRCCFDMAASIYFPSSFTCLPYSSSPFRHWRALMSSPRLYSIPSMRGVATPSTLSPCLVLAAHPPTPTRPPASAPAWCHLSTSASISISFDLI
ncbi:hypothetical protein B0H16DRAFT_1601358 [Mycena metata]|uniref:Uncharacterized protein n=1 Tax=Mycena metata TaxID=1033252 RepID=A0AAD7HJ94_9AGAR|nr:hypothetical protein B0H16DRAFT_1601358 [Mycena metata]